MSGGKHSKKGLGKAMGGEYYRVLAESSLDLIFVVDHELNHLYVNAAAAASLGMQPEEVIGRNWLEFFPEDDFSQQAGLLRQVLGSGDSIKVEHELEIPASGGNVWLSTSLTPLKDDDGMIIGVMGVSRDISSIKKAEVSLRESEKKYRTLAEAAQDFIYIVDGEGVITYLNEHGARMFGTTRVEVEGRRMEELFPPDVAESQMASVRSVMEADMPLYAESRTVLPMGDMWLGTSLTPLKDDEGTVYAVLGISRNITAKKKSDTELLAEKDFSDKAINSMPGIFYLFNEKGHFIRWNKTFQYISGYSAEEMEHAHPLDFFEGDDRELIAARIKDVFRDGRAEAEADFISRDGKRRRYFFTGYRMETGDDVYLVGVGTDVSALRSTEEKLAERDERLRLALEGTGDGIWDWDVVSGSIGFDDHWQRQLGYRPGERPFDFQWWEEHIDPKSKPVFEKALNDYLEGRKPVYEIEYRMKKKDGEWIWIWAIGKCVAWDSNNEPLRLIGTHRDITGRKELESMLAVQRDRAQQYLDIAPAMIVALDREGTISMVNNKGCELLGCEAGEAIGRNWFDNFIPEELRAEVREVYEQLMAGDIDPVEHYENPVVGSDGRRRIIAWHNTILHDDEGNISGTLSSGDDVTDRRQAEAMLRESEQRFKTMFDVAITGILLADLKTKRFALSNDTICEMLGYTRDELAKMTVGDIHPAEDLERVTETFEEQARGEKKIARDLPVRRKDGSIFYADISSALVTLAGVDYLMGYFSDSTDRHEAEAALMESEEKYRTLFEESNDVIFISTPAGRLLDINAAGVTLFGYPSKEELLAVDIGKEIFRDASARDSYQEAIERDGQVNDYELRLRKRDGAGLIVSVTAKAVKDESGKVTAYRGMMRDITGQRQLESQLIQAQKMESIGNLAGGVAHDFNNYLTAIQGYADLALLEHSESGELQDYLNEIRNSSGRAADLTRQLLLFGRREEVDLQPIDLVGTVTNLQKMLSRLIGERYTVVTRMAGNLEMVMADKGLVEQVIVNLVVNARDAMPDGGEITVDAVNTHLDRKALAQAQGLEPGDYVRLRIADQGMGIEADARKHIFEPFFTTKEVGKGTGLGLSVVYGIVAQHHGMIEVESEAGAGTAFDIYLPAASDQEKIYASKLESEIHSDGGGAKLLLVEDDDAVRNLAARMLAENGYDVTTAASAAEAEQLFIDGDKDMDVVFSDVILPDGNGLEMVERLLRHKPQLGVVLASGYTGEDVDRRQIEEKGFIFIQKPYTLAQMVETVGQTVKR